MKRSGLILASLLAAGSIWGCGAGSSNENVSSPSTSALPTSTYKAVLLKSSDDLSRASALELLLGIDRSSAPDPSKHDVLIVESSNGVPVDARIDQFLAARKTVIFTNVSEAEKSRALTSRVGMATRGKSRAISVRYELDRFRRPHHRIAEWKDNGALWEQFEPILERHLSAVSDSSDSGYNFTPPQGAIYVQYSYGTNFAPTIFTATGAGPDRVTTPQYTNLTGEIDFWVFLQNQPNLVTGPYQIVLVESNLTASPFDGKLSTSLAASSVSPPRNVGWFQTELDEIVQPTSNDLLFLNNSPQNTDGSKQVTTGFNIGLNAASPDGGGGLSFGFEHDVTQTIDSWNIINRGSQSSGSWAYQSNDPYRAGDPDRWKTILAGGGVGAFGHLKLPNTLGGEKLQADTQICWRTQTMLSTIEPINILITQKFGNLYGLGGLDGLASQELSFDKTENFQLDLSKVVPDPILGITFSPPDADGNLVGTITFQNPAQNNFPVFLTSGSVNAVITHPAQALQGSNQAEFLVQTNKTGIPSGTFKDVTIDAYDGTSFSSTLRIQN